MLVLGTGGGSIVGDAFSVVFCLGERMMGGSNAIPIVKHIAISKARTRFDYGAATGPGL